MIIFFCDRESGDLSFVKKKTPLIYKTKQKRNKHAQLSSQVEKLVIVVILAQVSWFLATLSYDCAHIYSLDLCF